MFIIIGKDAIDICQSIHDELADNGQCVLIMAENSSVNMSLHSKMGKTKRFNVISSGAQDGLWYDGSTNQQPFSSKYSKDSEASLVCKNRVAQEVRETQLSYSSVPTVLTSFSCKVARIGVSWTSSVIVIPMTRLKENFPDFNWSKNNMTKWLKVKSTKGNGNIFTATFFCADTIVGIKLDSQVSSGIGPAVAVVSNMTANATNLTIIFSLQLVQGQS